MAGPRAVLFDVGNVMVRWDPRTLYSKIFPDPAERDRFLAEVCTLAWHAEHDRGVPMARNRGPLIARHPRYEQAILDWDARFDEMLIGVIPETIAAMDALHARGVPLYGLTNWSHETFPFARERFDFLTLFDGIVVSGEEGMIKPDPKLYRTLLERYDIDPSRAVFIDDNRANVEAADALGIHGIHFHTPEQLRADLVALGFLPQ